MATKSAVTKGATSSNKKATGTKASKPAAAKKTATIKTSKPAASKKTATRSVKSGKRVPSHEEISQKAHEIYMERMAKGEPGDQDGDWHKAVDQF